MSVGGVVGLLQGGHSTDSPAEVLLHEVQEFGGFVVFRGVGVGFEEEAELAGVDVQHHRVVSGF